MISMLITDDQGLDPQGPADGSLKPNPTLAVARRGRRRQPRALAQARLPDPDVILMDVRMPGLERGIEATSPARSGRVQKQILMLTTFNLDEYVYHALRDGAQRLPAQGRHAATGCPPASARSRR